ncbi:MAG: aminotransferase class IV [Acidimicrobiales bacterium]
MPNVLWLNGRLVAVEEASISPFDHGLLTGDGVFETLRVYGGVAFAARRHLGRLARSVSILGLPMPDPAVLIEAMAAVAAANGLGDGRLRITVTGGVSPLGSGRGSGPPTVLVAAGPLAQWAPATDVVVVPWPRNERGALAGAKTISYGENVVALAFAHERGADEAVFANTAGNLCEGTGTNVFVTVDGQLITPPLSAGCLAGVTRDLLTELVDVVEKDVPVEALAEADEAFLTSSTREVQPIATVDGRRLAAAPGPLTVGAAEAYRALVARTLDP